MQYRKPSVLLVDPDETAVAVLARRLEVAGFTQMSAATREAGLELAASQHPNVVITELDLADGDGKEFVMALRVGSAVPIIVLSRRGSEIDKIEALDSGADDYLVKPCGTGELLARLRAAVRRSARAAPQPVPSDGNYGPFHLDAAGRTIRVNGRLLVLTRLEFDLLAIFLRSPERLLSYRELATALGRENDEQTQRTLKVIISRLRRAISGTVFVLGNQFRLGYFLRAATS